MKGTRRVVRDRWIIVSSQQPRIKNYCPTCKQTRPFAPTRSIRLNGNGKRLDAWLIYHCQHCSRTWNRPVFERAAVHQLDPATLRDLETSAPHLVQKLAMDIHPWPAWKDQAVELCITRQNTELPADCVWHIVMCLSCPQKVRLDRVLGLGLGCSRGVIQRAIKRNLIHGNSKFARHGDDVVIEPGWDSGP